MKSKETVIEKALYRRLIWRIMPFLFLCCTFNFLDRTNISFAKLQMLADLQLTEKVYGLGAGIFFIGYIVFQIPSNLILHRIGARVWLSGMMIVWGIISSATMFVTSPVTFYIARFLLGVAEAGFWPGIILYLTLWFPVYRLAQIMALMYLSIAVSGIIGGPVSGWIMQQIHGAGELHGWQWLFLLEGLPTIILGIMLPFVLSDRIQSATWLNSMEKTLLETNLQTAQPKQAVNYSAWSVLKDLRVWKLSIIYFLLLMSGYSLIYYIPSLLKEAGVVSLLDIGLFTAIPYGAAMIAMLALTYSSDRFGERRWHLVVPLIMAAAGLVGVVHFDYSIMWSIVFISLACAGFLPSSPLLWSIPPNYITGVGAATAIAFISSCGNIGGFIAPLVMGYFRQMTGNNAIPYIVFALCLCVAALITLSLPKSKVNK